MSRMAKTAALAVVTTLVLAGAAQAAAGGTPASGWHIGYFQNTAPQPSNAQAPSAAPLAIASLNFTNQPNTSLLVTDQKAKFGGLLGDIRYKTVTATFTVSGVHGAFTYFGEPSCGGTTANARLYFDTSNAGGFDETHFWWSNPTSVTLNPASAVLANGTVTVTANVEGSEWSDFFGHHGNEEAYSAGFNAAAANVTDIGLSFGGGCFFENGVGTSDGSGSLTLNSFSVS